MNQEKKRSVTIHEAGHAVMAHLRGMEIYRVAFEPENEIEPGHLHWSGIDDFIVWPDGRKKNKAVIRKYKYTYLLILLAGTKAEQLVIGWVKGGYAGDTAFAWDIVKELLVGKSYDAQSAYMTWVGNTVKRMLTPYKELLVVIADRLVQSGSLSSDEFLSIMEGFKPNDHSTRNRQR